MVILAINRTGTGQRVLFRCVVSFHRVNSLHEDASDFQNSDFWQSGVGGWGDPNNDYQITDGAFATNFTLVYPSPHRVRRQYTPTATGADGVVTPLASEFTPEVQETLVNGFVADFINFQKTLEGGAHGAVHRIVGG